MMENVGYDEELINRENLPLAELEVDLKYQKEFWQEKSKVNWHLHRDRNT